MSNKKKYGQFMTTNYEYILQNMKIPDNISNIIEPFAGNGDLLNFIKNKNKYKITCFDIEPKKDFIEKRNTILNPPSYQDTFIITNPPYLARNKSNDKELFDKYDQNDLYKCFTKELITNKCLGGIVIVPLNFWCSIRASDIQLRKDFLNIYNIILINIFEEKVFNDTTYTICSFQFELKDMNDNNINPNNNEINIMIYPLKKEIITELNDENNYLIGGSIYNLKLKNISKTKYNITRLTKNNKYNKDNKNEKNVFITNILVKCIDDNNDKKLGLSFIDNDKDIYIDETPNLSSRTYASLIIEPKISKDKQKEIIHKVNKFINDYRIKYHSLFLTNYRESKDIARKRISFDLVYQIVEYILYYEDLLEDDSLEDSLEALKI
jgi:hypothetical protein